MSIYKITNITNLAGKRDFKYNSTLDINYVDCMAKKIIPIKPGEIVYLTISSLPLSVHRLKLNNLITVDEISEAELLKSMNDVKSKMTNIIKEVEEKNEEEKKSTQKSSKKHQVDKK
jgi:hypothetical protein